MCLTAYTDTVTSIVVILLIDVLFIIRLILFGCVHYFVLISHCRCDYRTYMAATLWVVVVLLTLHEVLAFGRSRLSILGAKFRNWYLAAELSFCHPWSGHRIWTCLENIINISWWNGLMEQLCFGLILDWVTLGRWRFSQLDLSKIGISFRYYTDGLSVELLCQTESILAVKPQVGSE